MVETSFEKTLIEVWRQTLVENADVVELGKERYLFGELPNKICGKWTSFSTGINWRVEAEPENEIPLGRYGTVWCKGDAVPKRGTLHGERC